MHSDNAGRIWRSALVWKCKDLQSDDTCWLSVRLASRVTPKVLMLIIILIHTWAPSVWATMKRALYKSTYLYASLTCMLHLPVCLTFVAAVLSFIGSFHFLDQPFAEIKDRPNGSTLVSAGVEFNQSLQCVIADVVGCSWLISPYFFVYFWISE